MLGMTTQACRPFQADRIACSIGALISASLGLGVATEIQTGVC